MAEALATNQVNVPFPDGISGMYCQAEDKVYVINEVLNYYQRKLSNLCMEQVLLLHHHMFDLGLLTEAKKVLLDLWNWRKCVPSSENTWVIKGLETKRKVREGKSDTARDIIKFFEIEDANLKVIFLTKKCELIPSKILESEAMRDIYVLLHKSESDYKNAMEILEQKTAEIDAHATLVTNMRDSLRDEIQERFRVLTSLLMERPLANNVASVENNTIANSNTTNSSDIVADSNDVVLNATEQGETVRTSTSTTETTAVTAVQVATPATAAAPAATAVSRAATAPAAAVQVDTTTAAATADSPVTEGVGTVLPETPSTTVDVPSDVETQVAPNDSEGPEEGEILSDGYDTVSESSFFTVRDEQQNEQPWSIAGSRRRVNYWFNRNQQQQQQRYQQQQNQQQRQQQQNHHQRQQLRSHTRDRGEDEQTAGRLARSNYIKSNQKRSMILDQGSNIIPFSAVKDMHKYELFITNLSLDTDIEVMKIHISGKLGTDISIKPMRKVGAKCLSIGLFFSSEYDNLNMKMPGLWPVGTEVYKWDINRSSYSGNRRNHTRGSVSAHGQSHQSPGNDRQNDAQRRQNTSATSGYRRRYPRLRDQFN